MNIIDVIKQVTDEPTKKFANGYNTIEFGDDEYEIKIKDNEGNEVIVMLSGYKETL